MKTGRKSLLWGVHQFLWHPWTVYRAWMHLYGRPTWKEAVCIFIHDWGYWKCEKMDDEKGQEHPWFGAIIAGRLFGRKYFELVLFHSRHLAKKRYWQPSKLCWADKLSITFDPPWFYLLRARMSGEIKEYRKNAEKWIPLNEPDMVWFEWIRTKFAELAAEKRIDTMPYMQTECNHERV